MNKGPEGVRGALGPGPGALERDLGSCGGACPATPGRVRSPASRAPSGAAELTESLAGAGPEARARPSGLLTSAMSCYYALRLRDERLLTPGSTGPGHIGLARGEPARTGRGGGRQSQPAADPVLSLRSPETVQPPPSPVHNSSSSSSSTPPSFPAGSSVTSLPRRPPLLPRFHSALRLVGRFGGSWSLHSCSQRTFSFSFRSWR